MNNQLQNYARRTLKDNLAQLTTSLIGQCNRLNDLL